MKLNSLIKALSLLIFTFILLMTFVSCNNEDTSAKATTPTTKPTTVPSGTSQSIATEGPNPNSPEGKAYAELNKVIEFINTHFKSNSVWYPIEGNQALSVVKTSEGQYRCQNNGKDYPLNLATILESIKASFELDGTFSSQGHDVIYTLADESASAKWENIDAFNMDEYIQSDEYKETIANASKASLRTEVEQFKKIIQVELITNNNKININSDVYIYENNIGILCTNQGTIADALMLLVSKNKNFSQFTGSIFFMEGETLMYSSQRYSEYSVPCYE